MALEWRFLGRALAPCPDLHEVRGRELNDGHIGNADLESDLKQASRHGARATPRIPPVARAIISRQVYGLRTAMLVPLLSPSGSWFFLDA